MQAMEGHLSECRICSAEAIAEFKLKRHIRRNVRTFALAGQPSGRTLTEVPEREGGLPWLWMQVAFVGISALLLWTVYSRDQAFSAEFTDLHETGVAALSTGKM